MKYELVIAIRKGNLSLGFDGIKLSLDGSRGNGGILAHDLLEHGPFEYIGPVYEEHMALGSMLFIRGQGEINGMPPKKYIAHITAMLSHYAKKYGMRGEIPEQPDCEVLNEIDEILQMSYQFKIATEFDYEEYLEQATKLMSVGYNRAVKFWEGDRKKANQMFRVIEAAASIDPKDYQLNDRYVLDVDYKNVTASIMKLK
jgi:hypothetical protein